MQQMKQGETAKFTCPNDIDLGGNPNQFTHFGNGWLPTGTDMTWEITIKECDLDPVSFHPRPPVDDFKPGQPLRGFDNFRMISNEKNVFGSQMVLEVDETDKYAPLVTGLYNVFLNERKQGNDRQLWFYNPEDRTIHNKFFPKMALLEGQNNNLVVYKNLLMANQVFEYKNKEKHMICENTKNAINP